MVYHSEAATSKIATYYPVREGRREDQLEQLFRTFSKIKAIEDSHRGDISRQLQKLKGFGGIRTVNNAHCSLLKTVESVKYIVRRSIATKRTILYA